MPPVHTAMPSIHIHISSYHIVLVCSYSYHQPSDLLHQPSAIVHLRNSRIFVSSVRFVFVSLRNSRIFVPSVRFVFVHLRLPKTSCHIHMPVGLETNTLFFQQRPLARPPWCRASLFVHHPMTRQLLCPWRIP